MIPREWYKCCTHKISAITHYRSPDRKNIHILLKVDGGSEAANSALLKYTQETHRKSSSKDVNRNDRRRGGKHMITCLWSLAPVVKRLSLSLLLLSHFFMIFHLLYIPSGSTWLRTTLYYWSDYLFSPTKIWLDFHMIWKHRCIMTSNHCTPI